jgi:hypothetical protein
MPSTAPPRKRVSYEAFQAKAPAAATTAATATTEADKVKEEEEEMEMACRRCHPDVWQSQHGVLSGVEGLQRRNHTAGATSHGGAVGDRARMEGDGGSPN